MGKLVLWDNCNFTQEGTGTLCHGGGDCHIETLDFASNGQPAILLASGSFWACYMLSAVESEKGLCSYST